MTVCQADLVNYDRAFMLCFLRGYLLRSTDAEEQKCKSS